MLKYYIILALITVLCFIAFLRFSREAGILDLPNERSLHSYPVVRGGGVVYVVAVTFYQCWYGGLSGWFYCAFCLLTVISFLDDCRGLGPMLRLAVHAAAGILIWKAWGAPLENIAITVAIILFVVYGLNMYNFMDGVNGMLPAYTFAVLAGIALVNWQVRAVDFTAIFTLAIANVIFLFANFRKTAICFAGDVGSISVASVVIFMTGQLVFSTGSLLFLLFFSLFILDTSITLVLRISAGKNPFQAHREHLYQNITAKIDSPLRVSTAYAIGQLLINILVSIVYTLRVTSTINLASILLLTLICLFAGFRKKIY